jgi:phage terminase small subunit
MSDLRQWRKFAARYVVHFNATRAAKEAGFSAKSAGNQGHLLLKNPKIRAMIDERLAEVHMSADEALARLADIARGDVGEFFDEDGNLNLGDKSKLIKRIRKKVTKYQGKYTDREIETEEIELYSALDALEKILRVHDKIKGDNEFTLKVVYTDKKQDAERTGD